MTRNITRTPSTESKWQHNDCAYFRHIHDVAGIDGQIVKLFHVKGRGAAKNCGFPNNQFFLRWSRSLYSEVWGLLQPVFSGFMSYDICSQSKILGPLVSHLLDHFILASQLKE